MKKLTIVLFSSIFLLFGTACKTSKIGNSGNQPEGLPSMGKKVPFLKTYFIGNNKYNPAVFEPQLNYEDAMQVQYYLHGNIAIMGTLVEGRQTIESGVVNVGHVADHVSTVFNNGIKLVLIRIDGNKFIVKGNIQGVDIQLPFVPGEGGMYFFRPQNGKIMYGKYSFVVTPSSYESYLQIVVNKSRKDKSTNTEAEGISIEQASPDNGDSDGGDYNYNNGGNNNYNEPSYNNSPSTQPSTTPQNQPAKKTYPPGTRPN